MVLQVINHLQAEFVLTRGSVALCWSVTDRRLVLILVWIHVPKPRKLDPV